MLSVFTDGTILSVYTDIITEGLFRILKKKTGQYVEVFESDFIDGITEGFKPGSQYSDVTPSLTESQRKSPTKNFCR
jgi:hypothetical protein